MKHTTIPSLLATAALMLITGCCTAPRAETYSLWPTGAPGSEGQTGPEVTSTEGTGATAFVAVTHINDPSITVFLPPAGKATGAGLIIAPGGGHKLLAIEHEGYAVARALSSQGIACFVLKYRLAKEPNSPYKVEVHELMDAQRAIRMVRSRAGEWGVDPHRLGMMGFSAGGELATLVATRFDKPVAGTNEDVDRLSCRPDFVALMYPGGLTDPKAIPVGPQTPPMFLCCAYDDRPGISKNLAEFYVVLKDAGVPAEIHIYNGGGHGFGVRPGDTRPDATWTDRFVDWMRDRGLLTNKPT